jgi:phosphoglycerate dehydrogenase-like enzyme
MRSWPTGSSSFFPRYPSGSCESPPEGWRWVHLTSSGPDPFVGWGPLPGDPLRTCSRGANARSTAEWIIGAILHFHRDFGHYVRSSDEGKWERRWARELRGRTMVVLGAGAAGAEAARLASALDLRTFGVSRSGRPLPGFDRMVRSDQVDMVWGLGDVTVVLLPLTQQTRGSIGAERIVRLKAGSLLLVVSRGGIMDEQVVVQAVRSGHLAGAAFDVFSQEPLPADSPLRRDPRILITPHVAGTTDRFMERVQDLLGRLPADCSMDDVVYHLYVIQQIDRGLADVEAGRTIPHEEVLEPARGRRRDRSRWRLPATRRTPDVRSAPSRGGRRNRR